MKKNKKRFSLLLIIGLLILGAYGYLRGWDTYITNPGIPDEIRPHMREIEALREEVSKSGKEVSEERIEALVRKLPERVQRVYDLGIKAATHDVFFYGKVVDQHNQPVENALIGYEVVGQYLARGSGQGTLYTDAEGNFLIMGSGSSISIREISHPQIQYHGKPLKGGGGYNTTYIRNYRKYDTPDKRMVFPVWRSEQFENVITGNRRFTIPADGRIYTLDFTRYLSTQQHYARSKYDRFLLLKEVSDQGHVQLSCEREAMTHNGDHKDWKFTVAGNNGGVVRSTARYNYMAPETGYEPSITIERKAAEKKYGPDHGYAPNQFFYFTAQYGKYYGFIDVDFDSFGEKTKCVMNVDYKLNLEGGRNLSLKGWDRKVD